VCIPARQYIISFYPFEGVNRGHSKNKQNRLPKAK